jgi:hypothetical protein
MRAIGVGREVADFRHFAGDEAKASFKSSATGVGCEVTGFQNTGLGCEVTDFSRFQNAGVEFETGFRSSATGVGCEVTEFSRFQNAGVEVDSTGGCEVTDFSLFQNAVEVETTGFRSSTTGIECEVTDFDSACGVGSGAGSERNHGSSRRGQSEPHAKGVEFEDTAFE